MIKTVWRVYILVMIGGLAAPSIVCASWCVTPSQSTPLETYTIVGRGDTLSTVLHNIESIIVGSKTYPIRIGRGDTLDSILHNIESTILRSQIDSLLSSGITPAGMVLIPAGEFQIRSSDPAARNDEQPVRTVYVNAFFMDKYEVTNAQYKQFIDTNPQWSKDRIESWCHDGDYLKHWNGNDYPWGEGHHPVTYVSWYAAMAYAEWTGKRLPTEAEWAQAARGGLVGKKYPWGDSIHANKANYTENGGRRILPSHSFRGTFSSCSYDNGGLTTRVGRDSPNGYGLYDMGGNAREWCLDEHNMDLNPNYPRLNQIAGGPITMLIDISTSVQASRVLRGGSWIYNPEELRAVPRFGLSLPSRAHDDVGFRCVKTQGPLTLLPIFPLAPVKQSLTRN